MAREHWTTRLLLSLESLPQGGGAMATARAGGAGSSYGVPGRWRGVRAARMPLSIVGGIVAGVDACLLVAIGIALWALHVAPGHIASFDQYLAATGIGGLAFVVGEQISGGYAEGRLRRPGQGVARDLLTWTVVIGGLVFFGFALKVSAEFSRAWLIGWFLASSAGIAGSRVLLAHALDRLAINGVVREKIAIFGCGRRGERLMRHLVERNDPFVRLVGVFDDGRTFPADGIRCRGGLDDLVAAARRGEIDTVAIALPWSAADRIQQVASALRAASVDIRLSPGEIGFRLVQPGWRRIASIPMLSVQERPIKEWHAVAKWMEDKLCAALGLVLLSPVMAVAALAIRLESPGPVLFSQLRYGFNNEAIRVLKFRSMHVRGQDLTGAARTVRSDPRVTRVGRILRRTSIDELPQLINVLKGEMSIVGPRPHALSMRVGDAYYFDAVRDYAARHRVRPGITGLAQVNDLRGEIDSMEKARRRVAYDLAYIERWSLGLDIRIILQTLLAVVRTRNAY